MGTSKPYQPLSVLVVDDNDDGAQTLAILLRLAGHDVRTAGHPQSAIEIVGDFAPDAILMDLGLPEMDGYQLAVKLCEKLKCKPMLVAVTGFGHMAERSRREGFDHHLLKPIDPDELERILRGHAERLAGATCGA